MSSKLWGHLPRWKRARMTVCVWRHKTLNRLRVRLGMCTHTSTFGPVGGPYHCVWCGEYVAG